MINKISCEICCLAFNDKEKIPKIVCKNGHSICLSCLKDIYKHNYLCPNCREKIEKPPEELITNLMVLQFNTEMEEEEEVPKSEEEKNEKEESINKNNSKISEDIMEKYEDLILGNSINCPIAQKFLLEREGTEEEKQKYMNKKIISARILSYPKSGYKATAGVRGVLPSSVIPLSVHILIELTLEDSDIIILEYGKYYSQKDPRYIRKLIHNGHVYFFLNKDGSRFYSISEELEGLIQKFNSYNENQKKNFLGSQKEFTKDHALYYILKSNYDMNTDPFQYLDNLIQRNEKVVELGVGKLMIFSCSVDEDNLITIEKLISALYSDKASWNADDYSTTTKNDQYFGAACIKHLKMKRKNESDKNHIYEKASLPSCMQRQLINNEGITAYTVATRIPIVGFFVDLIGKK